jgi:hypothetical protein
VRIPSFLSQKEQFWEGVVVESNETGLGEALEECGIPIWSSSEKWDQTPRKVVIGLHESIPQASYRLQVMGAHRRLKKVLYRLALRRRRQIEAELGKISNEWIKTLDLAPAAID